MALDGRDEEHLLRVPAAVRDADHQIRFGLEVL
jgi:hypothetical protein